VTDFEGQSCDNENAESTVSADSVLASNGGRRKRTRATRPPIGHARFSDTLQTFPAVKADLCRDFARDYQNGDWRDQMSLAQWAEAHPLAHGETIDFSEEYLPRDSVLRACSLSGNRSSHELDEQRKAGCREGEE